MNLAQVTGSDDSILYEWQQTAQEKCISYLVQKYDTSSEFTDTMIWDISRIYNAGDRVYLDAPGFLQSTNYSAGDLATYNGNLYSANATTTGVFDPSKWILIGRQYDKYFGALPKPMFNINTFYNTDDQVYWKGKTYTAVSSSSYPDRIQYSQQSSIPPINYFPDYLVNGQPNSQWGTGSSFSIPAGTEISNALWTKGDNRSQQMVQTCIDIVLFYVHQRISPNNIPELRVFNYNMAIQWLKDAAVGNVTPNLPVKQPNQGHRIRFGGNTKLNNSY
ncbi:hypothetical protein DIU36_24600 [Mucilaginibacter rubeus]|nr:hypothetical protein DIU36_24600 [Mucilaginibacter rubeus]